MHGVMIGLLLSLSAITAAYAEGGWVDELTEAFAASNIQFSRSGSNVPFLPMAFLDGFSYSNVEVKADGVVLGSFDQSTISQGAGLPILLLGLFLILNTIDSVLWQSAYTEFYFSDLLWPDFNAEEFRRVVSNFARRERRFGAVPG